MGGKHFVAAVDGHNDVPHTVVTLGTRVGTVPESSVGIVPAKSFELSRSRPNIGNGG